MLRDRSRGGFVAAQNAVNYQTYPVSDLNRTWSNPVYGNGYPNGIYQRMTDVVTPGYAKLVKEGKLTFSPMSSYKRTAQVYGSSLAYKDTVPTGSAPQYNWEGRLIGDEFGETCSMALGPTFDPPSLVDPGQIEDLCEEVSTDVWAKVGTQSTQLLESIAEYQQTLNMLHRPAQGLFTWAKKFDGGYYKALSLRKASYKKASTPGGVSDFVQGVMSLYLETRYGLKPLVSDLVGILAALDVVELGDHWTTRASGVLSAGPSRREVVLQRGQAIITLLLESEQSVTVRGTSADIVRMTLAKRLGLSLSQVPVTLWNLTTLSFVVDWFVNVSSFISAMTPKLDVRNRGNCLSIRDERKTSITVKSCVPARSGLVIVTPLVGTGLITLSTYLRGPLRSPSLKIRNDFGFSKTTRILDALAIAGQRVMRLQRLIALVPASARARFTD